MSRCCAILSRCLPLVSICVCVLQLADINRGHHCAVMSHLGSNRGHHCAVMSHVGVNRGHHNDVPSHHRCKSIGIRRYPDTKTQKQQTHRHTEKPMCLQPPTSHLQPPPTSTPPHPTPPTSNLGSPSEGRRLEVAFCRHLCCILSAR